MVLSLQLRLIVQDIFAMFKNKVIVVENVGGVDETACGVNMNPINSLLDVEMYMYNVVATCQKMMMLNLYYTSSSLAMEFTTWQDIN